MNDKKKQELLTKVMSTIRNKYNDTEKDKGFNPYWNGYHYSEAIELAIAETEKLKDEEFEKQNEEHECEVYCENCIEGKYELESYEKEIESLKQQLKEKDELINKIDWYFCNNCQKPCPSSMRYCSEKCRELKQEWAEKEFQKESEKLEDLSDASRLPSSNSQNSKLCKDCKTYKPVKCLLCEAQDCVMIQNQAKQETIAKILDLIDNKISQIGKNVHDTSLGTSFGIRFGIQQLEELKKSIKENEKA